MNDRLCGCGYREILHRDDSSGGAYCELAKARHELVCLRTEVARVEKYLREAIASDLFGGAWSRGRREGLQEALNAIAFEQADDALERLARAGALEAEG